MCVLSFWRNASKSKKTTLFLKYFHLRYQFIGRRNVVRKEDVLQTSRRERAFGKYSYGLQ